MPQAIAVRIGGTKNGSVISTSSTPRYGVSVRAMIQASRIATASDGTVLAKEMPIVLSSTTSVVRGHDLPVAVEIELRRSVPGGVECRLP